jgi:hypothetical protein
MIAHFERINTIKEYRHTNTRKKITKKNPKNEKKQKKKTKIKKRGGIKYRNGSFPSSSFEAHHHIFQRKALQFFNFSLEKKRKLL